MKRRVIYQVVTDRFAGSGGAQLNGLTRSGPASRWMQFAGGNFEGLQARLSHVTRLGASALWLSPIYHNSYLTAEKRKPRRDGYHGYWSRDFERLEPHFGTEQQLQSLLRACHQHDIRPILDVVLNHSNPTYSVDKGSLWRGGRMFARHSPDKDGCFHHLGFLDQRRSYDPYWWENGDVWNLADLAQENPRVRAYLREAHIKWLSFGFSGVRLDTALHLPAAYIREWKREMKAAVPGCDFFFGEWWNGGPHDEVSSGLSREAGMPLTDFGLAHLLRMVVAGVSPLERLQEWVNYQEDYLEPDLKVNFLDNHDMPRLKNRLLDLGFSETQADRRIELALILLMLWRGVPCLYYGIELGLFTRRRGPGKSWGHDPYNREPMRFPGAETPGMRLCSLLSGWRRESDLVEHPLQWKDKGTRGAQLWRGPVRLEFRLSSKDELTAASLYWKSESVWEREFR